MARPAQRRRSAAKFFFIGISPVRPNWFRPERNEARTLVLPAATALSEYRQNLWRQVSRPCRDAQAFHENFLLAPPPLCPPPFHVPHLRGQIFRTGILALPAPPASGIRNPPTVRRTRESLAPPVQGDHMETSLLPQSAIARELSCAGALFWALGPADPALLPGQLGGRIPMVCRDFTKPANLPAASCLRDRWSVLFVPVDSALSVGAVA